VQIAPGIANALMNIVQSFEDAPGHVLDSSMVRSALCLTLFVARSLPTILLPNTISSLLWCCGHGFVVDHIFLTRFLAELTTLLLTRCLGSTSEANISSLLSVVLDESWLSGTLLEASNIVTANTNTNSHAKKMMFKDRFVLSLCRAAERLFPVVVSRYAASSTASSNGSASSGAVGGREFGFANQLTVTEMVDNNSQQRGGSDGELLLQRYVACVSIILQKCHRCLDWPVRGLVGESAVLSYISLVRAMSSIMRGSGVLGRIYSDNNSGGDQISVVSEQIIEFNNVIEMLANITGLSALASNGNANTQTPGPAASSSAKSVSSITSSTKSFVATAGPGISNSLEVGWSVNAHRLLLRVLVLHYVSGTDLATQTRGLDLLQASLLSGQLRVCDVHQLLQLLEFAANNSAIGANNMELRRKCLTMMWTFERFITGEEDPTNNVTSASSKSTASSVNAGSRTVKGDNLLGSAYNLPQLRNAIQATRLRLEMSPSEPSTPMRPKPLCSIYDSDYEEFMDQDITEQLQNTLQSTVSSKHLTASQPSRFSVRKSIGSTTNSRGGGGALLRASFNGVADAGLEFGVFSVTALQLAKEYVHGHQQAAVGGDSGGADSVGSRISCAELTCIVDDVQTAFLSPVPAGFAAGTASNNKSNCTALTHGGKNASGSTGSGAVDELLDQLEYLRSAGGGPGSPSWVRLTGSGDPLVLLASSHCDDCNVVHVRVRVTNCSGFKIPYFSLQMLLKYSGDGFADPTHNRNSRNQGVISSSSNRNNLNSNGLSAVMVTDQQMVLAGDEFFAPNATIEKVFSFRLLAFDAVDVQFRVIYSDLQSEDRSNVFTIPNNNPDAAADGQGASQSGKGNTAKQSSSGGGGSARSFTNSVNCDPLHVGIASQLIPYGSGVFCSMRALLQPGNPIVHKIPLGVLQALCGRMTHIGTGVVVLSELLADSGVDSIYVAVEAATTTHNSCNNSSSNDFNRMGTSSCLNAAMVEMGHTKTANSTQVLAWCLQTAFGQEICIRISLFPSVASGQQRGLVEVQCADERLLQTVFSDMDDLLYRLTGGVLKLVPSSENNTGRANSINNSSLRGQSNVGTIAYSSALKERYDRFAASISSVLNAS
jgi:hypothetical protein